MKMKLKKGDRVKIFSSQIVESGGKTYEAKAESMGTVIEINKGITQTMTEDGYLTNITEIVVESYTIMTDDNYTMTLQGDYHERKI